MAKVADPAWPRDGGGDGRRRGSELTLAWHAVGILAFGTQPEASKCSTTGPRTDPRPAPFSSRLALLRRDGTEAVGADCCPVFGGGGATTGACRPVRFSTSSQHPVELHHIRDLSCSCLPSSSGGRAGTTMADIVDRATRSRMMAGIGSRNTRPELVLRRAIHARGLRYRLHDRRLPGTPDLVFRRFGAVCLVHGCFWHRHAGCPYATTPTTRAARLGCQKLPI